MHIALISSEAGAWPAAPPQSAPAAATEGSRYDAMVQRMARLRQRMAQPTLAQPDADTDAQGRSLQSDELLALSRADLVGAIELGHIYPVFQPQISALHGGIVGLEVLARWSDKGRVHAPDKFVENLAGHGVENLLLDHFLRACARVQARFPCYCGRFSLNVNPCTAAAAGFIPAMLRMSMSHGLDIARVVLELTEQTRLSREGEMRLLENLSALSARGMVISQDDFGAGYASLQALGLLPFKQVKIDKTMLHRARHAERARRLLSLSMELARALELQTVAEGVENDEDMALARSLGADLLQGYAISAPVPFEGLDQLTL
ncbi:EAL domain-containing protein [Cupriavidus sp. 2TAF22]|uniref:EAL domain-containing protein n=1 Tax=unclassified Cupriavidus TaxID=2640874 RepID=UPI003F921425